MAQVNWKGLMKTYPVLSLLVYITSLCFELLWYEQYLEPKGQRSLLSAATKMENKIQLLHRVMGGCCYCITTKVKSKGIIFEAGDADLVTI